MADTEGLLIRDSAALGMESFQDVTPEGATYAWHPGVGRILAFTITPLDKTAATATAAAGGIPYGAIDSTTENHVDMDGLTATGKYRLWAKGTGV